jgi:hypothetical protein
VTTASSSPGGSAGRARRRCCSSGSAGENGITQPLTKPYPPTTTGKVERWYPTLQTDFLDDVGPFASIEAAQAAVDARRQEYNADRPHQSLDIATPATRFRPSLDAADMMPDPAGAALANDRLTVSSPTTGMPALETVKHHLKLSRQRSGEPRQLWALALGSG